MSEEAITPPAEGEGAAQTKWFEAPGLDFQPEEIGYIQNKAWDNPAKAIRSYMELEKFKGVPEDRLVKLPKDATDQAGWDAVFNKLGRPGKPEEYGEFKSPEGIPAEALDGERVKWADNIMHKLGLNKAQRDGLIAENLKYEFERVSGHSKEVTAKADAELVGLQKEWGAAFDERAELGRRATKAFLPGDADAKDALFNKLEQSIGTAAVLKLFANIGEKIGEDRMPHPEGTRPFGQTREQAMAEKASLMAEIQTDKTRLAAYNLGKGTDYERMRNLMLRIAS